MNHLMSSNLRIGAWLVEPALGRISKDEQIVRLEARTMRLLLCLAGKPGEVVSVEELLSHVWAGVIVTPDSVYQAITSLRRQLGDDARQPSYIETVPRLGYRLVAAVSPCAQPATAAPNPGGPAATPPDALSAGAPPMGAPPALGGSRRARALIAIGAIVLVLVGAYLVHGRWPSGRAAMPLSAAPVHAVAVLPFADLTTQEMNEEYFADGLTEELIGDLGKMPELRVPGPTASFYFKGRSLPVADIARQLRVAYVLDGSVRKAGGLYRVAARLVRADSGYVIWTETYERPLGNLLDVQKGIAAEVAPAIRAAIGNAATTAPPTSSKP